MAFRTFSENVFTQPLLASVSPTNNQFLPASGSFIDASYFKNFGFVIQLDTCTDPMVFTVFQDTSATATGSIKAVTGLTQTVVATTDNGKFAIIEGDDAKLDSGNGFKFITLKVTGVVAGTNKVGVNFHAWNLRSLPAVQPTAFAYKVVSVI